MIARSSLLVALLGTIPIPHFRVPLPPSLLSGLSWRNLGPFRAGRVSAVSGAIGQAGTFYMGLPMGGVWKTTSAGETWYPVFDSVKEASSVGAIAVAPSNPDVIYVGMGDLIAGGGISEGNGVYKSTDAGRTWQHLGLDETKQIPSILVDPKNPDLVLLAAQGDVHKKSDTRGVYRSTDGGRTWTKTLYVDDSTGAQKIAWADDQPGVLLATTVRHYNRPPTGLPRFGAPGVGAGGGGGGGPNAPTQTHLFKSTDEGVTWKEITGGGLPRLTGRTSVAVANNTNAQRMFLIQNSGLWRSDDGGGTWRQMDSTDTRIRNGQGGYNCGVYVDPKNPDIVYTVNAASYKSTDGGNTFTGFKGAPGGDDPQQLWIDPTNGQRMLFGYDQGAIVTLDGGATWSSWYNQSTEQVYHIAVDNSYPAWVYASQQDAGAVRTRLRGNQGAITPLDWNPVPGWEWGSEAPDPLNPNIVYASGIGIFKINYPSEQWIDVSPQLDPALHARQSISQPIAFAPWNPRELVAAWQFVMTSLDGGAHWTRISPDLGYPKDTVPTPDSLRGKPGLLVGGTIQSMALSPVKRGEIWVGTNTSLIKRTQDEGKTWQDMSVPNQPGDILAIEASHFDAAEAYVVFAFYSAGDYTPYYYRTRDYGKTWTLITNGFATGQASGSFARVVREDPKTRGLLFAGTESGMYVSFDDGDHWQSLQLNLPNTSCRDLVVHGNDLVLGTYGRGIWVLDDISALRQMTAAMPSELVQLFIPGEAVRVRRNVGNDTPFPPEVPHALNPPDGAIIYYSLATKPAGAITLDVLDAAGTVVRHMTSGPVESVKEAARPPEPNFWITPPFRLPAEAGGNRTNWDLRADAPPAFTHTFEINANPGLTPPSPQGPLVPPGVYTLRLTVDGKSYTQRVTVVNDPRSPATTADVVAQYALQTKLTTAMQTAWNAYRQVAELRTSVRADTATSYPAPVIAAAKVFDSTLAAVGGDPERSGGFGGGGFRPGGPPPPTFVGVNNTLAGQTNALENGDMAPTPAMLAAYAAACRDLGTALATWKGITGVQLTAFNALLKQHNLSQLSAGGLTPGACTL